MTTRPGAKERLAEMRDRAKNGGTKDAPSVKPTNPETPGQGFGFQRWYGKIREDVERVTEAAAYYERAVADGAQYVVPKGNLEELLLQQPGLKFFYKGILVDAQQSRRWLEERADRLEAGKHNYYMYDAEAKEEYGNLKTTEASKLAKADPEIMGLHDNIRLLAYHEHNLENLMEVLSGIDYVLNNVTTLRENNLEEVWVDPTTETSNG